MLARKQNKISDRVSHVYDLFLSVEFLRWQFQVALVTVVVMSLVQALHSKIVLRFSGTIAEHFCRLTMDFSELK